MKLVHSARNNGIFDAFRNNEALLILCVQVFVLHIGQSLIVPLLPLYAETFVINTTLVGLLLTFQAVPRVFISLPAGRLADRWGANRTLFVAAMVVALSGIIGGLAPNYAVLLISRIVQGFGTAISMISGLTYAANISNSENRGRHVSLFQGSFLLGNSIGPVIGGYTAQFLGYQAPFFVYAVLSVLVAIWILVRLPDPRSIGGGTDILRKKRPDFMVSMRSMLRNPGVVLVSMISLLAAYTRRGSRDMALPLIGSQIGATEGQIGFALTAIFLMNALVIYWAGSLADRYGTKAVIVPSWIITALGLFLLGYAPVYSILLLGASIYGLGAGVGSPVPAAYVAAVVDEESQGMAMGVYRTFNDIGLIIGPTVMGWIADSSGIANGVIANAAVVAAAAVIFYFFAPDPEKSKQPVRARI
jgi:MFS family permease